MDASPAIIIPTFKIIGAAAGAAKRSNEFKIPAWKETMEINNKKGKVMRHKSMVKATFSGFSIKPGARILTTQGMHNSKMIVNRIKKNVSKEMALAANSTDLSRPDATSFEENNGTNADVNAPSAKRLLNKFGNLNATKNASETMPAPRKLAMTMSRKKPVKRLSMSICRSMYKSFPEFIECYSKMPDTYNRQMEELDKLERDGKAFVVYPSVPPTVKVADKDKEKLNDLYYLGKKDMEAALGRLMEFIDE